MSSGMRNTKPIPSLRAQNPLFRRVIIPWYDTEPVCYFTIVFVAVVIAFSLAGIVEANSTPQFKQHIWIPTLLFIMSLIVFFSTIMRLIKRKSEK